MPLVILFQESYPKLSAEVAGDRKYDVYMGIDVFGRGSFGGGQWTVCLRNSFRTPTNNMSSLSH